TKTHNSEVVLARLAGREGVESRLSDSLQTTLDKGDGNVVVNVIGGEDIHFSENFSCPECGFTISEMEPRLFSFNAPYGACPDCDGLGMKMAIDERLVVPLHDLSRDEGALQPWQPISSNYYQTLLRQTCRYFNIDMDVHFEHLSAANRKLVLSGSKSETVDYVFKQDNGVTRRRTMPYE